MLLPHLPRLESFPPPVVEVWVIAMAIGVAGALGYFSACIRPIEPANWTRSRRCVTSEARKSGSGKRSMAFVMKKAEELMFQVTSSTEASPRSTSRRHARLAGVLAMAAALAGCSAWEPGPEPDRYVGPGNGAVQRVTDPSLEAVAPLVPGDKAGGGAELPGALVNPLQPATQPAATQPATQPAATQSATRPPRNRTATRATRCHSPCRCRTRFWWV